MGAEADEAVAVGVVQPGRPTADRGARITRHTFTGLGVSFGAGDRATVTFLSLNFSGCGEPPLTDATLPVIISDTRLECRREQGEWRIAELHGAPVFAGRDAFMNQLLIGGS